MDSDESAALEGPAGRGLARILDRGGWVVSRFAVRLGWTEEPRLLRILAMPLLSEDPPASVAAWRLAAGGLSYGELEGLFRRHGGPPPKQVLDRLRVAGAVVWAAGLGEAPERRLVASRLGYASGAYLGRRVKAMTGRPLGRLLRLPADRAVEALLRPLGPPPA